MLDQVNRVFGIAPDHDLNIITPGQSLTEITTRTLTGLEPLLKAERPDLVLVQGDTTTCFAASLASFYQQIPVAHLEAGLRTDNRYNPFPEEINRRLTTQLASLHLAPTSIARDNLLACGVAPATITVTGNTVIDALLEVTASEHPISDPTLALLASSRATPLLLVTSHRRESWGEPLTRTASAIARLVQAFPDLHVLLPAHRNPIVRDALLPTLGGLDRVHVTEPLDYPDFCRALQLATIVLTDSGGVQEEAPALGKPVLVLRETTERPEAVLAGAARLVGTDPEAIVAETTRLLTDPDYFQSMITAGNPYGDGRAAQRAVDAMAHLLGLGDAPDEFRP
jgi:UDP-N-acetylglucosamine 2-epimerase (non-hydrolysing)